MVLKPYKLPDDQDPTQVESVCPKCNSCMNDKDPTCPNCKNVVTPTRGKAFPHRTPYRQERHPVYGPKDIFISPNIMLKRGTILMIKKIMQKLVKKL